MNGKYLVVCPRDVGKQATAGHPVHNIRYQGTTIEEAVKAWNNALSGELQ